MRGIEACEGKQVFPSRGAAMLAVQAQTHRRGSLRNRKANADWREKLNAYRCDRCGQYHIGSSQK